MNFATIFKAIDTFNKFRDVAKRFAASGAAAANPPAEAASPTALQGFAGQVEARLTNVVVAALKEAFDRDHARLELERAHMEEERRRADEALRFELRRQSADRELGRLRLLAGAAMVGWIASVAMLALRASAASTPARIVIAASWLLLLGALAAAFTAQQHVGAHVPERANESTAGPAATAALWLLVGGLATAAISLLL
jgi:hypothetical protein